MLDFSMEGRGSLTRFGEFHFREMIFRDAESLNVGGKSFLGGAAGKRKEEKGDSYILFLWKCDLELQLGWCKIWIQFDRQSRFKEVKTYNGESRAFVRKFFFFFFNLQ